MYYTVLHITLQNIHSILRITQLVFFLKNSYKSTLKDRDMARSSMFFMSTRRRRLTQERERKRETERNREEEENERERKR